MNNTFIKTFKKIPWGYLIVALIILAAQIYEMVCEPTTFTLIAGSFIIIVILVATIAILVNRLNN